MFSVMNRSEESWGPLAKCEDYDFYGIINDHRGNTKQKIKDHIKNQKKLKTYRVTFIKEWFTDSVELQAEDDWNIGRVARDYFEKNQSKLGFKEQPVSKWADGYKGYDRITYNKVRT